jgi:hypothetical protein
MTRMRVLRIAPLGRARPALALAGLHRPDRRLTLGFDHLGGVLVFHQSSSVCPWLPVLQNSVPPNALLTQCHIMQKSV